LEHGNIQMAEDCSLPHQPATTSNLTIPLPPGTAILKKSSVDIIFVVFLNRRC